MNFQCRQQCEFCVIGMSTDSSSKGPWLDFSGAPPLLIPQQLARHWRGRTDPSTGDYRECDADNPVTDYDRACAAAWLRPEHGGVQGNVDTGSLF